MAPGEGVREKKNRYFSYFFLCFVLGFFLQKAIKGLTAHREAHTTKLNLQTQKANKLLGNPV